MITIPYKERSTLKFGRMIRATQYVRASITIGQWTKRVRSGILALVWEKKNTIDKSETAAIQMCFALFLNASLFSPRKFHVKLYCGRQEFQTWLLIDWENNGHVNRKSRQKIHVK